MSDWLASFALAATLTVGGCGGARTEPIGAGPFRASETEIFDGLVSSARSHGYEVLAADAASGSIQLRAHTPGRRGAPLTFRVQCYRPGYFQVVPDGVGVYRRMDHLSMSGDLYSEYVQLVIDLSAALPGSPSARREEMR